MADDKKFSWDDETKAAPAAGGRSSFSWDNETGLEPEKKTATAVAEPPKPKPTAMERLAEVTTGFQHPIDEFGRELKSIYHKPAQLAGDVSETIGIPRNVWSDPSLKNIGQIGGTGLPGIIFGEHGAIKHPIEFGKTVTGANQAAEDVRTGNLKAIPGDIAGGLANLALLKKPVEAGAAAGGEALSNAKQGLADMTRTPTGELQPATHTLSRVVGAGLGHASGIPGGEIIGALGGPSLAEAVLPKRIPTPSKMGFYSPFNEAEQIEKLGGKVAEAEKARLHQITEESRLQQIEEANKPKPVPELGSPENPGFHSKLPTTMPKKIEAPPPTPELGSPENPGWHSKIPNTMPKAALPNIAPEQAGPPAQLPAGGSTQKLQTAFQKETKPQILNFNDLANKIFNVKPLEPNTPLKEQLTNAPPKPIEEVDPIKAKYPDPGVRQMVRANGERIYEAAKSDPNTVKALHDLTRVDLRQALVNSGEDMGQTTVSNSKFAGEGSIPREEAFNRLLDKGLTPEKIVELAKKTEGTANDRPQVKYKGGINVKGVEASSKSLPVEEQITGLSNQITDWNKELRTTGRTQNEKDALREQINEYQTRLDELRGAKK